MDEKQYKIKKTRSGYVWEILNSKNEVVARSAKTYTTAHTCKRGLDRFIDYVVDYSY